MTEIWKDIPDYEGLYQASNFGNVKRNSSNNYLMPWLNNCGYLQIRLSNKKIKTFSLHRLIWQTFNGKTNLQIDHINGIKTDNRLCNLQALTPQENTIKHHLSTNKSSKYIGVSWYKNTNKWVSYIRINGKIKNIGYFTTEEDAYNARINFFE